MRAKPSRMTSEAKQQQSPQNVFVVVVGGGVSFILFWFGLGGSELQMRNQLTFPTSDSLVTDMIQTTSQL